MARFDFEGFADHLLADSGLHRSRSGTAFGVMSGVPTHVGVGTDANGNAYLAVIVGTRSPEAGAQVKAAWLGGDEELKRSQVEVQPAGVLAKIPVRRAAKAEYDLLEARVRELSRLAASVPGAAPERGPGARAALVDDVPMFLSETEAGEIQLQSSAASAQFQELRPRYLRGVLMGLVGTVVAAAVWAAIAYFLDWSGWIVAIGAGVLIGLLTVRGAGKPNRAIQVIIAVLSVGSVVLGDVVAAALAVRDIAGVLDLGVAFDIYRAVLTDDTGFALFTIGGALVGAWYGSRFGRPVDVGSQVELAPR